MSPALRRYLHVVIALGALVLGSSLVVVLRTPKPLEWLLLAGLALVAGSFTMKVASVPTIVSVTDTFFVTSILLFGPAPATITVALDSCLVSWRRGYGWKQVAFNTAETSLSIWLAGHAFYLIAGIRPISEGMPAIGAMIVPLAALTTIYFLLNSGLTAVAVGLDTGQSPLAIWRRHFLWIAHTYFAASSASLCLILVVHQAGLAAVAVMLPLLGASYLTLQASFGRLEDAHAHLKDKDRLYLSTIETLAMAIDAKDDATHSHVRRVQAYAVALADALGISDEATIKAIKAAALLHDTGKLAVPERILNKPGGLTAAEFEQMKLHVDVGADILSLVEFPYPVVPIVRCHHESWNGSGYPRGLSGEDIPIGARILSVVDCYDALTSDRPYRSAWSDEAAVEMLRERRGTMYDPRVVDLFIAIRRDVELTADAPRERDVLQRIAQSRVLPLPVPRTDPAGSGMSGEVLAFVSLARLASGDITLADVLALASTLIRDLVPGVTAAWYVHDAGSDALVVMEASGPAADFLRGTRVNVCERLTGWVAANRQVVVNSDAVLDLGTRAHSAAPALQSCLSAPLISGDSLVGVLTLYAPERQAFTDDHGRLVQMIAPHVGQAISRAKSQQAGDTATDSPQAAATARDLRLVSSRS